MYSSIQSVRIITGFTEADSNGRMKVSDETIQMAIEEADGIIDSKIASVYRLPLVGNSKTLRAISKQIAKGLLYSGEYGEETQNLDKGWEQILEFYLGLLDDIFNQKMILVDEDTGQEFPRSSTKMPAFYPNRRSGRSLRDNTRSHITVNSVW